MRSSGGEMVNYKKLFGRWGQPPEVGSAVAFLASDAASYISGSTLLIDAGWTAIDGPPTGLTQVG
ncbi:MAG: SDR family oxidoreductase [Betaproteobacteria bacterium]|nr:MAG: SDR family oxidoreductase [Betaproteobacteria bacterium]